MDAKIALKEDFQETVLLISRQEMKIIKSVAEGKKNKAIAEELGISIKTVETHRHNVMKRLQCPNMPNLIHILHQEKLLS